VICVNFVGVWNSCKNTFFFARFLNCKTYSMEQSSSSKVNSSFTSQECTRILWNPKIYYRVHKSPPLVPILNQINSVHNLKGNLRETLDIITPPKSLFSKFGIWEALQLGSPPSWVRPWYPLYHLCLLLQLVDGDNRFL